MISAALFEPHKRARARSGHLSKAHHCRRGPERRKDVHPVPGADACFRGASGARRRRTNRCRDALSDEVAFWLYSSGSTGDPKGVKHVQTCLIATGRLFGQDVLGIGGNDVVFSAGKFVLRLWARQFDGVPNVRGRHDGILVPEPATPQKVIETMRKYHPTVFFGGPALYAALLVHGEIGPGAGSERLRRCVSGGDILPASVSERWRGDRWRRHRRGRRRETEILLLS